jgi:hypothetical protein
MKLIRLDEETGTRIKRSVPKQANVMKRHGSRELTLDLCYQNTGSLWHIWTAR